MRFVVKYFEAGEVLPERCNIYNGSVAGRSAALECIDIFTVRYTTMEKWRERPLRIDREISDGLWVVYAEDEVNEFGPVSL